MTRVTKQLQDTVIFGCLKCNVVLDLLRILKCIPMAPHPGSSLRCEIDRGRST